MRRSPVPLLLAAVVAALCGGALFWPMLIHTGVLLGGDMAVIDHPALMSDSALGFGSLPARNAPQDGLMALIGLVFEASYAVRVFLTLAVIGGGVGAAALARHLHSSVAGQVAAAVVTVANPFVVERLFAGQWSLVIAAWLLPAVSWAALSGKVSRMILLIWLCSMTPTGAVAAGVTALLCSCRFRHAVTVVATTFTVSLPWLVPALARWKTHTGIDQTAAVHAFLPRSEHVPHGVVGTVLGLGGFWNADAVPPSREMGWAAILGIVFFVVLILGGVRHCPPRLWLIGALFVALTLGASFFPNHAAWVATTIPGMALFRDSQKLLLLALPAYAGLTAGLGRGKLKNLLPILGAGLLLASVWDAPLMAQNKLSPVAADPSWTQLQKQAQNRRVFADDRSQLVSFAGRTTVDPVSKAVDLINPGDLVVDGRVIDPLTTSYRQAQTAWANNDIVTLQKLRVGLVIDRLGGFHDTGLAAPGIPPQQGLGLGLLIWWILIPPLVAAVTRSHRRTDG